MRAEALIFASPVPVERAVLSRVVGKECNIELLMEDLKEQVEGRAFELVAVAGGWQYRTKRRMADVIIASGLVKTETVDLSENDGLVLMSIAYFQPVTRGELSRIFGREISRDTIAALRSMSLIESGPRSPQPGAPYTYVTTAAFLSRFGLNTLRELPDFEALEDAGLLSKEALLREGTDELDNVLGLDGDGDE